MKLPRQVTRDERRSMENPHCRVNENRLVKHTLKRVRDSTWGRIFEENAILEVREPAVGRRSVKPYDCV